MSDTQTPALIWCPFPDPATAEAAAGRLIDEGLVACANLIGQTVSLYAWQGQRKRTDETGVLLKTNAAMLTRAIGRLTELHPYEEPAVLGWHCDAAAPATALWLSALSR